MRLLERKPDGDLIFHEFIDKNIPAYAILSHTWLANNHEEISFQDVEAGTGKGKTKAGWEKIQFCADNAAADSLRYFWIDTCCIKKSSDSELSESLNSMFLWYQRAAKCYVYLSDVSMTRRERKGKNIDIAWEHAFRQSRWFTRGWTLQELLAPRSVEFFSREGYLLGDKRSLEGQIHEITGIAILALRGTPLSQFSVDERLLWVEKRQTTRKEDEAYSLLGIFGVYMPPIYGEGRDHAFKRLRREMERSSNDERQAEQTTKYTIKPMSMTHTVSDNGLHLCLLSLDGGGVRGLPSLIILEELMRKIDPTNPPKPCDYFDMMGGTNTGGLIAIMLGRLEMSIKDCREAYRVLSNDVFQPKNYIAKPWFRMPWNWHIKGRFDSDALEKGIKRIIVQELKKRLSSAGKTDEELENTLLHDENAKCKVLVIRAVHPKSIS
jgi:hypothetical protein